MNKPAPTAVFFPRTADFARMNVTYLDAAYSHPIGLGAKAALDRYLDFRMKGPSPDAVNVAVVREVVHAQFARLIGAEADEVSLVSSTMAGENLVLAALGLTAGKGRVITDGLHFPGSLYLYEQLARRGVEVTVVRPRGGAVPLEELEAALARPADLVALSLVSNYNGFRHDLDAVCAMAHAQGVPVYADIIQAAGAVPFDVRASGVDFCACASYKWLMGDFGVGFLYVRRDRLAGFEADAFGYRQLAELHSHPDRDPPVTWRRREDATGLFALGTTANGVVSQLHHALRYIEDLGVAAMTSHRNGLLARLREGLRAAGVSILTPEDPGTPILAFAPVDLQGAASRLNQAGVFASVYDNRIRVAPSVYNDEADIDLLLRAVT